MFLPTMNAVRCGEMNSEATFVRSLQIRSTHEILLKSYKYVVVGFLGMSVMKVW